MGELYGRVSDVGVEIDGYRLSLRSVDVSKGFERVTTEIEVRGGGEVGRGEDVIYDDEYHTSWVEDPPRLPTGSFTIDSFSERLGDLELFSEAPSREYYRSYRRWGVESAVLDLGLRQSGTGLGEALGRDYSDVRFVVSRDLGDPPTADAIREVTEAYPEAEFKLDATTDWDSGLVEEIPKERVKIVDLKGQYDADLDVTQPPDPDLYEMVRDGFPEALIEDPRLTDETREILSGHERRVSWDKPVEGVEDVRSLDPDWVNIKPSRFGSVESLFDTVEYCEENTVEMYGGGQFEIGAGRPQIQELASLFYPDSPNDVAPRSYHTSPLEGVPKSPIKVSESEGFSRSP